MTHLGVMGQEFVSFLRHIAAMKARDHEETEEEAFQSIRQRTLARLFAATARNKQEMMDRVSRAVMLRS